MCKEQNNYAVFINNNYYEIAAQVLWLDAMWDQYSPKKWTILQTETRSPDHTIVICPNFCQNYIMLLFLYITF